MKRILLMVFSLFIFIDVSAQGVNFEDITMEQAMAKAKKSKKLLFLDCYTSWCGPCKRMSVSVFPQKICGDYFNANFICVKKDLEKDVEAGSISNKYDVRVFPTFLIINEKGEEINRFVGYADADKFVTSIQKLVASPIGELEKRFYENPKDSELGLNLVKTLVMGYKDASVVFTRLYDNATDEIKYTDDFYQWMFAAIKPSSKILDDIIVNFEKAKIKIGKEQVNKYASDFFSNYLMETLRSFEEPRMDEINRAVLALDALNLDKSDPNRYVGEIVLACHLGNDNAIINCVVTNFHNIPPCKLKLRLETFMKKSDNEKDNLRIKAYYEEQAKHMKETFDHYNRILEHFNN